MNAPKVPSKKGDGKKKGSVASTLPPPAREVVAQFVGQQNREQRYRESQPFEQIRAAMKQQQITGPDQIRIQRLARVEAGGNGRSINSGGNER